MIKKDTVWGAYNPETGGLDRYSQEYLELHKRDKFLKRLMLFHTLIDNLSSEEIRCVEARIMIRIQELEEELAKKA